MPTAINTRRKSSRLSAPASAMDCGAARSSRGRNAKTDMTRNFTQGVKNASDGVITSLPRRAVLAPGLIRAKAVRVNGMLQPEPHRFLCARGLRMSTSRTNRLALVLPPLQASLM
jgi:hypothetical protein